MSEQKFPDIPEPEELPRKRLISSVTYWWIGTFVLLGFTIVWLPSQCSTKSITPVDQKKNDINKKNNVFLYKFRKAIYLIC